MKILNVECKVKVADIVPYEKLLLTINPRFEGEDHQIDTYYDVPEGRVKLREGNIENSLIYYDRQNTADSKSSSVILHKTHHAASLKAVLGKMAPVAKVVDKKRRIYFVDNVKFHFDRVMGLGTFVEVEAIDADGTIGLDKLKEQCEHYIDFLKLHRDDFVAESYSDLV